MLCSHNKKLDSHCVITCPRQRTPLSSNGACATEIVILLSVRKLNHEHLQTAVYRAQYLYGRLSWSVSYCDGVMILAPPREKAWGCDKRLISCDKTIGIVDDGRISGMALENRHRVSKPRAIVSNMSTCNGLDSH